jgi:flagellar hook assembly protein FlgD
VRLTIYNLRGEKVKELVNVHQSKGWREVVWNGRNSQGKTVASGVYFCKLQADQGSEIIRMILLK